MTATGPYKSGGLRCRAHPVGLAGLVGVVGCCLAACGSAGGNEPDDFAKIGFIGALSPGIGFVGGGKAYHDAGPSPHDGGQHDGDGQGQNMMGSSSGGNSSGGNSSGASGGGSSSGSSGAGSSSGASSSGGNDDAGDGGSSVGVILNLPPGFFEYLNWTISGPGGTYSGSVSFGAAQSIEFVVGGIQAGSGYTLTLMGSDPAGDPCRGTSAPFTVTAGGTTGVAVIIECFTGDGAAQPSMIMTGNVAVDAGVLQH